MDPGQTIQTDEILVSGEESGEDESDLALPRQELGAMIKFITGFNFLSYHAFNMDKCYHERCRLCREGREDAEHIATRRGYSSNPPWPWGTGATELVRG